MSNHKNRLAKLEKIAQPATAANPYVTMEKDELLKIIRAKLDAILREEETFPNQKWTPEHEQMKNKLQRIADAQSQQ